MTLGTCGTHCYCRATTTGMFCCMCGFEQPRNFMVSTNATAAAPTVQTFYPLLSNATVTATTYVPTVMHE